MMEKRSLARHFRILLFFVFTTFIFFGLPSSLSAQDVEAFTNLGISNGRIYNIAIDPSNPDKMFTGTYLGDGLFTTMNGGGSWQAVETNGSLTGEDEFKNHAVYAVKIAPNNPDVIWVTHNYWAEKSIDGGITWDHIFNRDMQRDCQNCGGTGDNFRLCRSMVIDHSDPHTVYVGTGGPFGAYPSGAIYKTTDGGTSWMKMNQGNNFDYSVNDLEIDPNNPKIIWAVTSSFGSPSWQGTLYRSDNGGETWTAVFSINGGFYNVEIKPNNPNSIFTSNKEGLFRHYFNSEAGQWKYEQILTGEASDVRSLAFDPQDPEILYAGWRVDGIGKVGRSTDGGKNWDIYSGDFQFTALTVHPANGEIIYAGDINSGAYKSLNYGQTWTPINNGINAVIVYDVKIDPNDSTHILAATNAGIYERKGEGAWLRLTKSSTRSLLFHPTNSLIFYTGLDGLANRDGKVAKTTDGGLTWTNSNILGNGNNRVSDIVIDNTDTNILYVAIDGYDQLGGIYKSTNGGDYFNEVLDGVNQAGENYPFNAVAIDPSDNQHIFAGGGNFFTPMILGDLWESTDGGSHWIRSSLQNIIVNALLINPDNPNIMYAGTGYSGGTDIPIYKSVDKGVTWTASFEGIPGTGSWNSVTDLEFHRQNRNIVYASTLSKGIYVSNRARNWLSIGTPEYDVYAIATSSLYSATQGGLYQLTGTGVIAGKVKDAISQTDINGATVFTDMGAKSVSADGDYIMVSPAGICSVTAIANDHANKTENNVIVGGGDVTWMDISMQSGISDPTVGPEQNIDRTSGGGKYCFIATAAYGSPLSKQVEILRKFRDAFLLPNAIGRKLVDSYYRIGKPIAIYIESHPWLKPLVRLILYPLVGLAWLMLSTTTLTKVFIILCILIGCAAVIIVKSRMITTKTSAIILLFFTLFFLNNNLHAATLFQQVGIASSPNPVGSGARAIGMGGAFIGIADDATAASWNPAGLIQLEKPELSIVGAYFHRTEAFSSDVHHEIDNTSKIDDLNINYLSATYPFKFYRNMVMSINYQRLYDFKRSFNHLFDFSSLGLNLLQDKDFNQNGSVGALGLAYAIQITPRLSFGTSLNIWTDQLLWRNGWDETYSEHGTGSQGGVPVTIDTSITDKYSRFRGINANFGLLWDINNYLTIGAVVKTPFKASLRHEFRFKSTNTFGPPVDTTTSSQQNITEDVELRMPLSYGLGLAWRVSDALSFALDIYRTGWSKYILTDAQGNEFSPVDGRPESSSDVKDTTQIRIGGEYLFVGETTVVPVRGGLFYDPEPSHGSVKDFYGISVGTGIGYGRLIFDAAYQLRWGHDVDTGNLINTSNADITQHLLLTSVIVHF